MANLYKKPEKKTDPKTGQRVTRDSRKWWGRFRDEHGQDKRVPLVGDKTAAQTMLNDLVRKVERTIAGLEDPYEKHRKRPLKDHLADYKKCLENKGSTVGYVNATNSRVSTLIAACKFERIDHISASRVQEFLAGLRKSGKSIASSNHFLTAIRMFTHWLVGDRRTNDNRVAHLSKMNADLDRRRVRRPLSMEEFALLLDAAENGPSIQHIAGPDRAILYIIGTYTGYRRNEIGSVTVRSFDFVSEPPTLTVAAGHSKHRRTDILPLRHDFAVRIQAWIANKRKLKPDQPLIAISNKRTGEMIKKDLDAARAKWIKEAKDDSAEMKRREKSSFLAYQNESGQFADFHALRKAFITNLTRSGAAPKTAQLLARHSDINLTMNTYTMLGVMDQAAAVEALPPLPFGRAKTNVQTARATGTDGRMLPNDRPNRTKTATKTVTPVVTRGANMSAIRLASNGLRIAPTCTEKCKTDRPTPRAKNAKSPEKNGASRAASQHVASRCTVAEAGLEPARRLTRPRILSPVRLPIPPLGLKHQTGK